MNTVLKSLGHLGRFSPFTEAGQPKQAAQAAPQAAAAPALQLPGPPDVDVAGLSPARAPNLCGTSPE